MVNEVETGKKVKDLAFKELLSQIDIIWKKIIDKQIAEDLDEWRNLVSVHGSVETARDYLYQQINSVALCLDGDLTSFFEKAGIENEELMQDYSIGIKKFAEPALLVDRRHPQVPIIWLPSNLIANYRKRFRSIHELTHASDHFLSIDVRDKKNGQEVETKKLDGLSGINTKLSLLFLGVQIAITPISYMGSEVIDQKSLYSALALNLVGLTISLFRAHRSINNYNKTDREVKANRYAKEIMQDTL